MSDNSQRHITVTMPPKLRKALVDYVSSIPLPPGAKKSTSAYVNVAIIAQLEKDGIVIPTDTTEAAVSED